MGSLATFFQAVILGISIAAPVGPIGVLSIRRTLAYGRGVGLATGLGTALADSIYAALAGIGLSLVTAFLRREQSWIRLIGGLCLCVIAVQIARAKRPGLMEQAPAASARHLLAAFASSLALTLSNPTTILTFIAIFAGIGMAGPAHAAWLVAGVFTDSMTWWIVLVGAVGMLRARLQDRALRWVNWISAAVIGGFGAAAIIVALLTRLKP